MVTRETPSTGGEKARSPPTSERSPASTSSRSRPCLRKRSAARPSAVPLRIDQAAISATRGNPAISGHSMMTTPAIRLTAPSIAMGIEGVPRSSAGVAATRFKMPSTSAYAAKTNTRATNTRGGQKSADKPKVMPAMPRTANAHQFFARSAAIVEDLIGSDSSLQDSGSRGVPICRVSTARRSTCNSRARTGGTGRSWSLLSGGGARSVRSAGGAAGEPREHLEQRGHVALAVAQLSRQRDLDRELSGDAAALREQDSLAEGEHLLGDADVDGDLHEQRLLVRADPGHPGAELAKERLHTREDVRVAPGQDLQAALVRGVDAAGDGGAEHGGPQLPRGFGERERGGGTDGAHVDPDLAGCEPGEDAVRSGGDRRQRGIVLNHAEGHFGGAGDVARRLAPGESALDQGSRLGRRPIRSVHLVAGGKKAAGHPAPHRAEPDETNPGHPILRFVG